MVIDPYPQAVDKAGRSARLPSRPQSVKNRGVTPFSRRHPEARKLGRELLSGTVLGLLLCLALALGGADSVRAEPYDVETAALAPGGLKPSRELTLPQPLAEAEAERYRRIFSLQVRARWADADREIGKLADKILFGHVLAQRYLAPSGYHAKFAELSGWLERYADHPEAARIYRLARARAPKGAAPPRHPEGTAYSPAGAGSDGGSEPADGGALSAAEQHRLADLRHRIRHDIDEGAFASAEKALASGEAERLLGASEFDQLRGEIVSGYYFLNRDKEALAVADAAPVRAKRVNATAEWTAGLAAWRLQHYGVATRHFERLATADPVDSWMRSAGAYWAARGHLRAREPQKVTHWLEIAANYPYTFYGILARRLAGKPFDYNWELPTLTPADVNEITSVAPGRRALALVQVGEDARAEQELRHINPAQPEMARAIFAVSHRADMPSLVMQLAEQIVDANGRRYDSALYPVPSWGPQGGYSVDRALVLAVIRQESKFLAKATSPAGARGLMQLMPGTARFVAPGTEYGGRHHQLFEPELNIALGQNYITHLMGTDAIGENLFLIVAAYNGGPGNVARWQRQIKHGDDPLLFLEGIPNRETRQFVEHVIANYWIYRDQLGQPAPALDAIAEGKWPTYKGLDGLVVPVVAKNGGH